MEEIALKFQKFEMEEKIPLIHSELSRKDKDNRLRFKPNFIKRKAFNTFGIIIGIIIASFSLCLMVYFGGNFKNGQIQGTALSIEQEWENFKLIFNKTYSSKKEEMLRKKLFIENLIFIERHNANISKKFTLEMNQLGDRFEHELMGSTYRG